MGIVDRAPNSIIEARARMMQVALFFSSILYDQTKLVLVDGDANWGGIHVPTAMTDGYNIVMNVEFMDSLTVNQRVFVFAHEIYHVMAMHPKRMRKYAADGLCGYPFLIELFNIAADAVINKCLVVSGIGTMPPDLISIDRVGNHQITGTETAEEVYEWMLQQMPPQFLQKLQEVGAAAAAGVNLPGSGNGKDPLGNDVIPHSPDPNAAEAVSEAGMKAAIQQAATAAKSQGTLPAGLKRFIDEFLESKVPWEEELRDTIFTAAGNELSDWSRVNRHKIVFPGIGMPRRRGVQTGAIVCAVDTSGSVSNREMGQFLGEIASILGDMRPESLYLIWCDAAVDGVETPDDPEDLRHAVAVRGAGGGGGTSFIPPFKYIAENDIPCDTMIYLTDGMGPFPTEDMAPFATIWVISTNIQAPFGKTIHIECR